MAPPVCPRHPDRAAYVSCQRCGRPVCAECQRPAPVGVQCVDCVAEASRQAPKVTTRYGADVRRASARPLVTLTLIGLCVAVYIGQLASDDVTYEAMFVPVLAESQPWRFVTAAFAHSPGSFLHIAFNMYALWITGSYLEPMLGRLRFLVLYLVAAVGGSVGYLMLASVPTRPGESAGWVTPTVGASGAVFGLFAALLVLNRHMGRQTGPIVGVIAINAVLGFVVPNIAWQAHLGGAITGAAVAGVMALTSSSDRTVRTSTGRRGMVWLGILAILVVLVALSWWRLQQVDNQLLLSLYG